MDQARRAQYIEVLRAESDRINGLVSPLSPDAWDRPTACEHWDVATVVAHLTGAAEAFSDRVTRALQGDSSPPDGLPEAGSVNAGSWSGINSTRWISYRESLGRDGLSRELASRCETASRQFNDLIAGLAPDHWETGCYHPGGVIPIVTLVGLRVLELAVHGWDIQYGLDREAHLSRECLPVIVEFIPEYLKWFFAPGETLPQEVRYRFEFTDLATGGFGLAIRGDRAEVTRDHGDAPDVVFTSAAETFALLMCGRASQEDALAQGKLTFTGDPNLAARFSQWFRGA